MLSESKLSMHIIWPIHFAKKSSKKCIPIYIFPNFQLPPRAVLSVFIKTNLYLCNSYMMLLREFSALFFYFRKPGFYCFLCFTAISNTAYPFILFLNHNFSNINFQWLHYVYEWFYFFEVLLWRILFNSVCVCTCQHAYVWHCTQVEIKDD